MFKQYANWRPVFLKDIAGRTFVSDLPKLIDTKSGHTLLRRISTMERKTAISFGSAITMADQESFSAFIRGNVGRARYQSLWYFEHFVQWISEEGYHIELCGDEFDACFSGEKVS